MTWWQLALILWIGMGAVTAIPVIHEYLWNEKWVQGVRITSDHRVVCALMLFTCCMFGIIAAGIAYGRGIFGWYYRTVLTNGRERQP